MRKPFAVLVCFVALVALTAGLTACGSVEPTAVTVNGHRISQSAVDDELRQIRDNKRYRDALGLSGIEGDGKAGTFNAEFAAQVVTLRIYYRLVEEELERRDVELTAADLKAARESAEGSLGADPQTGAADPAAGRRVLAGFSKGYQDTLVRREALVAKLSEALSETDTSERALRAYYDEHAGEFTEVCARHVLVDTKEAADAVAGELRGGADFATVAKAQSKDPSAQQNNGDLGCAAASTYVAEFQKAVLEQPLNEIGAPVQTQFGWHVVVVSSRQPQPFAEVRDQIRQTLGSQSGDEVNQWLLDALEKAKVSVNRKFGRFDRSPGSGQLPRVVPPAAASSTTVAGP
jgi:parvulin-like peptidyl-prolyl isomerase